jgi:hypothetical protein
VASLLPQREFRISLIQQQSHLVAKQEKYSRNRCLKMVLTLQVWSVLESQSVICIGISKGLFQKKKDNPTA